MDARYLVDRVVGIYEEADVPFALRQLARDEREGGNAGRLSLFARCIATPLSAGALVNVIRETDDAFFVAVIDGGPPATFWVPIDNVVSIGEYVREMDDSGRHRGLYPHERLKVKPRVEPRVIDVADLPARPRKAKGKAVNLAFDDEPPAGFESLFDVEAA